MHLQSLLICQKNLVRHQGPSSTHQIKILFDGLMSFRSDLYFFLFEKPERLNVKIFKTLQEHDSLTPTTSNSNFLKAGGWDNDQNSDLLDGQPPPRIARISFSEPPEVRGTIFLSKDFSFRFEIVCVYANVGKLASLIYFLDKFYFVLAGSCFAGFRIHAITSNGSDCKA